MIDFAGQAYVFEHRTTHLFLFISKQNITVQRKRSKYLGSVFFHSVFLSNNNVTTNKLLIDTMFPQNICSENTYFIQPVLVRGYLIAIRSVQI